MTAPPAAPRTDWTHTPERSSMFMLRFMTWLSLRLGRTAARGVLLGIAAYFLLFAPASRRASREYLQRVFGRPAHWRELYRHIFTFAATIHDRIFLLNRRFDLFDFEVHGLEALRNLVASGNGLFLMGAHLGSFEVIRALGWKDTDLRIAMVMQEENARKINAMLAAINPEASTDIIGLGRIDSMLRVRDKLKQGAMVGMLADRSIGDDALLPTHLLGGINYADVWHATLSVLGSLQLLAAGMMLVRQRYALTPRAAQREIAARA